MGFTYSGIKKVEYYLSDAGTWTDLGTPLSDSTIGFDPQESETGKGTSLYAGEKKEHIFHIPDLSKYSALETIMKNNYEISVRITDVEDNVETIAENATVKVKKVYGGQVGSRNYFEMKITTFAV